MNTVQLRAGQTSQPFPVGIGSIVTITPAAISGGTGYIEYSFSSSADIQNNRGVWVIWPLGAVSIATSKTALFNFVARAVCSTGNITAVLADPTSSTALATVPWDANNATYLYAADGTFLGLGAPPGQTSDTPAMLYAARPTPSATTAGRQIRFLDVGGGTGNFGGGNFLFDTGARWKPVNGNLTLDSVDTANSAVANTAEQNLNPNHIVVPAALIGNFDRLRLWVSMSKNGTVDTSLIQIKYGPLGTIADPVIATVSALATTNQSIGFLLEFKRLSATTIQKQGNASTDVSYNGANAGAYPGPVTVANMDTTPMFLSITSTMTVGSEICTLQDYTLELYATDSA